MKNLNVLALVASISILFSSCSTNESLVPEEQSVDLLKTFTIQRDASGAYSLDYDLNDNAEVDNVKDIKTNTNEIYLYSSEYPSSKKMSQELAIENNQLNVGFMDTNSDKKQPKITIIDDNIVFARGADEEMLSEYAITGNEDGTYNLNFKVEDKVEVDFVYNEDEDIYEIHLEEGNGKTSSFERTFTKVEGSNLKIDFVNHLSTSFKGYAARETADPKKPRVIIQ